MTLTHLQKQLLDIIQRRLPVEPRPFAELARQLESDEAKIISEINHLRQSGIIRRIGAVFNAAHLGYVSTLVAAKIADRDIQNFVAEVNAMPGVSHNYGRDHSFNTWFTLTMTSQKLIDDTIEHLQKKYNTEAIYPLPAKKMFKINVQFDLGGNVEKQNDCIHTSQHPEIETASLTAGQIALIKQLQEDLPINSEPFETIAGAIEMDSSDILRQIKQWKETGLIRRFGASIKHQRIGFDTNAMVVFEIPAQQIDTAGQLLAQYRQVSHCYHRTTAADWPYSLFAMTHCQSVQELDGMVRQMVAQVNPLRYDVLVSTVEYKKTNVRFLE